MINKIFVIFFLAIFSITIVNGLVDPQLNKDRIDFLPSFLLKITENKFYALRNFTTHTAPEYCWNIEYSGSFCNEAAQDYTLILFVQQPVYNSTTGNTDYLQVSYVNINILTTELYDDTNPVYDTYIIKYVLNNTQLNGQTYTYQIQDGLYYNAYFSFKKNSLLVSSETIISQDGRTFNSPQFDQTDLAQLCYLITQIACPVGSIYQNYSSYEECIQVMQQIDHQNSIGHACPDIQVSNTTACRLLHAVTTLTDPPSSQAVHCPHAATPSTHCIDYCKDVCDNCGVNAHCEYDVDPFGTRSYHCICNDGWVGDGHNCTRTNCNATYQCATNGNNYNYVQCNTNTHLCGCTNSFTWNATTGVCECVGNNTVTWVNGVPECLQVGRCYDKTQCTTAGSNSRGVSQQVIGNWNQVSCVAYGALTTLFPHKTCVCNYGYQGGFFIPCQCNKTEIWSPDVQGNVCIDTTNECVANYSCPNGKVCNKQKGKSYGVGICE